MTGCGQKTGQAGNVVVWGHPEQGLGWKHDEQELNWPISNIKKTYK